MTMTNITLHPELKPTPQGAAGQASTLVGDDGFSFKDILDVVNPLQQLPGVSMLYRAATGDSISLVSRVAGGALFGGPVGAGIAFVSGLFQAMTGDEPMDALASAFKPEEPMQVADEAVARTPFASAPAPETSPVPLSEETIAQADDLKAKSYQAAVANVLMDTEIKTETFKG